MKCLLSAILSVGVMCASSAAFAADAVRQSTSTLNQRQIRGCMVKRMSSDRNLAYNEAKKSCADGVRAQNQAALALSAASSGAGK
ncbi:MAG: hypothetical protein ABJD53_11670 [Gammaproteobacteria bacterium]